MTLLAPTNGEGRMLKAIVNHTPPENLVLKLFTNNITPTETDTAGTYTEASGFGYAPITLPGPNWTITEGAPSEASYAEQTFIFTGPLGRVYGYFLVQAMSGIVMWAERFTDGPYKIVYHGDKILVAPRFELEHKSR